MNDMSAAAGNLTNLVVSLCVGVVMVAIHSWSRFDQPSYHTPSEHFARYEPRFATSHALYARAKWAYIGAVVGIYVILSLTPGMYSALSGKAVDISSIPWIVALGIVTLQDIPGLRELEQRIRGFLHAKARIPEAVRLTVAQLKGSPFNSLSEIETAQIRKIMALLGGAQYDPTAIRNLMQQDEVLQTWTKVGSLLFALSESKRPATGIDLLFFENYKDELDSINARYAAFADRIADDLRTRSIEVDDDSALLRDLRDIRDRLYTFVACGVHSSSKSDAERVEILRSLGFSISYTPEAIDISPLIGLSIIAMMTLSVFTGYSAQWFRDHWLEPLGPQWVSVFPIPSQPLEIYVWSLSTAAFYLAAIFGALSVRNTRIANRMWFDLNNLQRDRPILRYVTPTLLGAALGCVTLFAIALVGGPAFKPSIGNFSGAFVQSAPWFALSVFMAFIAVAVSDTQVIDDGSWRRRIIVNALCGAAVMVLVGFLISQLVISNLLKAQAGANSLVPKNVEDAGLYLSLFLAAQIGFIVLILCLLFQVFERFRMRPQSIAGKYLKVVTRQGLTFSMLFEPSGQASLLAETGAGVEAPQEIRQGRWQHFPEGTAVKWSGGPAGDSDHIGDFGLISGCGGSVIYEGYKDHFFGEAEFIAQVQIKSGEMGTLQSQRPLTASATGVTAS
ncbi:MAG: hypothetical protein WAL02_01240 [Rhodoplanes sp.]